MSTKAQLQEALDQCHVVINHFADVCTNMADGSVFRTMSCGEVESLADVLRLAGCEEEASAVIADHADYDQEGDDHYVEPDGAPCCPDPECSGRPCTFPGYVGGN